MQALLLRAGNYVVRDQAIRLDTEMVKALIENPDYYMSGIQPADRPLLDPRMADDATHIAFLFEKFERRLVGFAKLGMLRNWGMDVRPLLQSESRSYRLPRSSRIAAHPNVAADRMRSELDRDPATPAWLRDIIEHNRRQARQQAGRPREVDFSYWDDLHFLTNGHTAPER